MIQTVSSCSKLISSRPPLLEEKASQPAKAPSAPTSPVSGAFSLSTLPTTLWLFTESDFATFVFPGTLFGIFASLSGPLLTENATPDFLEIMTRLPQVMLWGWLSLLVFCLDNQRGPDSVVEDGINKPWRPLPAGRISAAQTRRLLRLALPVVLILNYHLGAWEETVLLFSLTWMYNDLGGGEEDFVTRNAILAIAFSQYNKGALRVASQSGFAVPVRTWQWLAMTSGVIATTMQIQDMKDQEGDKAKNRRTAPLVLGDGVTRWTIAIPTGVWSISCPLFWDLDVSGYALPVGIGATICARILFMRNFKADKHTWWLWTFWTVIIWMLPLFKNHDVFDRFPLELWNQTSG